MKTSKYFAVTAICLSIGTLTACGGGGGGGTPSEATTTTSSASVPPLSSNATPTLLAYVSDFGKAASAGMYAVSYGMGNINGALDESVWKSQLGNASSFFAIYSDVFAGNIYLGNDVLSDAHKPIFDPTAMAGQINSAYSRFDDASSTLTSGHSLNSTTFQVDQSWTVSLDTVDISGTAVQDFLLANSSLTKPIANLSVPGVFATGSNAYRIHYKSLADSFLYTGREPFLYDEASFTRSYACGQTSSNPYLIGYKVNPDGTLSFVQMPQGTACTPANLALGIPLGMGSWVHKTSGLIQYIELSFPAGLNQSKFDSRFLPSEYDGGIRSVIYTFPEYSSGYFLPKGLTVQSRNLALNLAAVNSLQTATGLKTATGL